MGLPKVASPRFSRAFYPRDEQCQMVNFVADALGFLGPGTPDLVTELCPPQDTA